MYIDFTCCPLQRPKLQIHPRWLTAWIPISARFATHFPRSSITSKQPPTGKETRQERGGDQEAWFRDITKQSRRVKRRYSWMLEDIVSKSDKKCTGRKTTWCTLMIWYNSNLARQSKRYKSRYLPTKAGRCAMWYRPKCVGGPVFVRIVCAGISWMSRVNLHKVLESTVALPRHCSTKASHLDLQHAPTTSRATATRQGRE